MFKKSKFNEELGKMGVQQLDKQALVKWLALEILERNGVDDRSVAGIREQSVVRDRQQVGSREQRAEHSQRQEAGW